MKIRLFTIPNLLTLANLFCGCLALVRILAFDDLRTAFWLVVLAAVFDFLDGFAARLLKSYSALGVQLDSLADMVSFSVVPSMALYNIYLASGGDPRWAFAVFILALFSALRLAKFNIDERQGEEFRGLPTPAAGIFVMSAGWLYASGAYAVSPVIVVLTALCLSWFLVSETRMFSLKFKNFAFRDNAVRYIFLGVSLAAVAAFRIAAIPFVILFYILLSIVLNLACRTGKE